MKTKDGSQPLVDRVDARIAALIRHGEETGCLELSEINELVESLELGDSEGATRSTLATKRGHFVPVRREPRGQ
jgi:hypothetical protein